ncbi:hypothetical protein FACS189425_10830 [Clostridia bacterium]|nr:hypothetical protein FACS189425_10830 [Clostridia bacterium]
MKFGANIKAARAAAKLTQDKTAELLNIPKGTYLSFERGEKEPSLYLLELIAETLSVPLERLMGFEQKLSERERRLVECCRGLGDDGARKLLEYAEDLAASGRYGGGQRGV